MLKKVIKLRSAQVLQIILKHNAKNYLTRNNTKSLS